MYLFNVSLDLLLCFVTFFHSDWSCDEICEYVIIMGFSGHIVSNTVLKTTVSSSEEIQSWKPQKHVVVIISLLYTKEITMCYCTLPLSKLPTLQQTNCQLCLKQIIMLIS